jgi:hypothetical protein
MGPLTKAEAARRQLGTALSLYLEARDPVSVHCLVCGGCELAEHLAIKSGGPPFRKLPLEAYPTMTVGSFIELRNKFWNAFKHSSKKNGVERDDSELLSTFSDIENVVRLFIGWTDYATAVGNLPIEAQIFQVWFLALDRSKLAPDVDQGFLLGLDREFPGLSVLPHDRQRQRLRRSIEKWRKVRRFMEDPQTDRRTLVLA